MLYSILLVMTVLNCLNCSDHFQEKVFKIIDIRFSWWCFWYIIDSSTQWLAWLQGGLLKKQSCDLASCWADCDMSAIIVNGQTSLNALIASIFVAIRRSVCCSTCELLLFILCRHGQFIYALFMIFTYCYSFVHNDWKYGWW